MGRLAGRDYDADADPMSNRATGLWFRRKGRPGRFQRYDEAPPYDGTVHWYLAEGGQTGWRAFRESDVKPAKAPR